ncbi:MAG: triose-phosphate isomerase [Vicinamibacteria bacterium]|jgi:triosephosphate isomerase|nr:triose-phosphate isomerase [Vicinamibacteria bacterium]MBP9944901.1 triose-phosphate isomerase [Vicinamibacteria bacterium]
MPRPLVVGNWKMHKTVAEARALATAVRDGVRDLADIDVAMAPPFTALAAVGEVLRGSSVGLAAQTMHESAKGAFTGEISPSMLKDVGCTHVILGHSERRHIFGETDQLIMKKARAAFDHALIPILCVGETLQERETSRTFDVVERQTEHALRHVTPEEAMRAVLAYEPFWAIGTGKTASPGQAQEVHTFIRKLVARSHGDAVARVIRILYGGSVKADNAGSLIAEPDVDGALVGGACLEAPSFLGIVNASRS